MKLNFEINNQYLKRVDTNYPFNKSKEYLEYEVTVSSDWENYPIMVIFGNEETFSNMLYNPNQTNYVPDYCLEKDHFWISFYTFTQEKRITTNAVKVDLGRSGYRTDIISPPNPEPDLLFQLFKIATEEAFVSATYENNFIKFKNKEGEVVKTIQITGEFASVQSDWAETDSEDLAFIKNKPAHIVEDENYQHTDNNYSDVEKSKVEGSKSKSELLDEYVRLEQFIIS